MKTLGQAANYFGNLAAGAYKSNLSPVLDMLGRAVQDEAKREIGHYQPGISPFPGTAKLAPATIERKIQRQHGMGGNPDTPLWATGAYHDSIQTAKDVSSLSVEIGSNEPHVIFHELGTRNMPQRAVFGPATLRAVPPLLPKVAQAGVWGMAGGVWKGLGVEGITHTPLGPSANILPE